MPSSSPQIEIETRSGALRLWNAGDGKIESDMSEWFEPFFHPDASRNSQTGGKSLGRAICNAIRSANG